MNSPGLAVRFSLSLALVLASSCAFGADTAAPSAPAGKPDETNSLETLRAYLQVQEGLRAAQLAIERNRQEAEAAATRNAAALAGRLQSIEQALAAQRTLELETVQSSYRLLLVASVAFAMVGFLALLVTAYFQGRTANRLAEIAAALPGGRLLGPGAAVGALGEGDTHLAALGPAEQSNLRLLGAINRLEKRIYGLEHTTHPLVTPDTAETPAPVRLQNPPPPSGGNPAAAEPAGLATPESGSRLKVLLAKGQSLLNLDKAEEALACFDEALSLEAGHTEALVKKGTALERLRKLDEALACYDRAIAVDDSLTMAYLHKGGLFNRLERFGEAVECYEQALRTQEKRNG